MKPSDAPGNRMGGEDPKPRVLFLDDDPNVLDGIATTLWKQRHTWELLFFTAPRDALARMAQGDIDVVVTDMQMPLMPGTTVLRTIRERSPATVRILLSGQADSASLIQSLPNVHHYLSKPCEPSTLLHAVQRAVALMERLPNKAVRAALGAQETLPAWPSCYWQLVRDVERDISPADLAVTIQCDPALCIKSLQLANSAYFGANQAIVAVRDAARLLGSSWFRLMSMSSHVFTPFVESMPGQSQAMRSLWERSVLTARLAAHIVDDAKDQAYTAGLLHAIGEIWVCSTQPQVYLDSIQLATQRKCPLHEVLGERLTTSIDVISSYMLALWGLPESLINSVGRLHASTGEDTQNNLVIALRIAAQMAHVATQPSLATGFAPIIGSLAGRGDAKEWQQYLNEEHSELQQYLAEREDTL